MNTPSFVLFLDFDGVLHPGTTGTMRHAAALESALRGYPEIQIVVSSTWRLTETLEELRGWFSPTLAARIVGVTPLLPAGPGSRQREIEQWLRANPARHWLALDDEAALFCPQCDWLVLTATKSGLDAQALEQLRDRLQAALGPRG